MKQVDYKNLETASGGDGFETTEAKISAEGLDAVFDIVSRQMYQDPIGSLVREITSNCFDSHIEAKVDDAVIVRFDEDDGGMYISFLDFGVGVSPERMKNVYSVWFTSTKKDTNDQIGFWGLGSKSPLSYADCFYLNTVHNNIKYEYIIHRGEKRPEIELVISYEVEERNGSEVRVYLNKKTDLNLFVKACFDQLRYFDNVYFDCKLPVSSYNPYGDLGNNIFGCLSNDYSILEAETFKIRAYKSAQPQTTQRGMHICLGKVYYPINWKVLNIEEIAISVAIKFEIGELCITPEREAIRYIDFKNDKGEEVNTVQIIKDRIVEVVKEIEALAANQRNECYDLLEFYNVRKDSDGFLLHLGDEEVKTTIYLDRWDDEYSDGFYPKLPEPIFAPFAEYPQIVIPKQPFNIIEVVLTYDIARKSYSEPYEALLYANYLDRLENYLVIRCTQKPEKKKRGDAKLEYYIEQADRQGKHALMFVKPVSLKDGRIKSLISSILPDYEVKTANYEKYNRLSLYKLYQTEVFKSIKNISISHNTPLPFEWLTAFKNAKREKRERVKVDTTVNIHVIDYMVQYKSTGKKLLELKALKNYTGFIIYGFKEDEEKLTIIRDLVYGSKVYGKSQVCSIFQIAARYEKHFIPISNAVYINTFMANTTSNRVLNKIATAFYLNEKYEDAIISHPVFNWNKIHGKGNKKEEIRSFILNYLNFNNKWNAEITDNYIKEVTEIVANNGGLEENIINIAEELNSYVKNLELFHYIKVDDRAIPYMVEYLRLKNKDILEIWNTLEESEKEVLFGFSDKIVYFYNKIIQDNIEDYDTRRAFKQYWNLIDDILKLIDMYFIYHFGKPIKQLSSSNN